MQCHLPGNSSLVSFDNFFTRLLSLAGNVIAIFEVGIWLFPGDTIYSTSIVLAADK